DPLPVLNRSLGWLGLAAVQGARLEPRNTRKYPPIETATAGRLREYFEPHNAALEALLGEQLHW
ncbi:MAG: hypothetical protein RL261_2558, partial [Pseudomonadota bacterium]